MGTLKIGSASNRAGVTIEPKTVLFNDNNVKYIKSGLIEIWSYIKPLVPPMTSDTTPSGEVIASGLIGGYEKFKAFDNNPLTSWAVDKTTLPQWVGYKFTSPANVNKVKIQNRDNSEDANPKTFVIQASNNGNDWFNVSDTLTNIYATNTSADYSRESEYTFENSGYYLYYRMYVTSTASGRNDSTQIASLQFYGSQLIALIPKMTSNTTPSGEASASSIYSNVYDAWKAFDGAEIEGWAPAKGAEKNSTYLQYKFDSPNRIKGIYTFYSGGGSYHSEVATFKIQGSDNGTTWNDIKTDIKVSCNHDVYILDNNKYYNYYRFVITDHTHYSLDVGNGYKFQLYK